MKTITWIALCTAVLLCGCGENSIVPTVHGAPPAPPAPPPVATIACTSHDPSTQDVPLEGYPNNAFFIDEDADGQHVAMISRQCQVDVLQNASMVTTVPIDVQHVRLWLGTQDGMLGESVVYLDVQKPGFRSVPLKLERDKHEDVIGSYDRDYSISMHLPAGTKLTLRNTFGFTGQCFNRATGQQDPNACLIQFSADLYGAI